MWRSDEFTMENVMTEDNATVQGYDRSCALYDHVFVKPDGGEIHCYGSVEWDSNFHLCCDDEEFDGVAADIDGEEHNTWDKVCQYVIENYRSDIVEITAV